MCQFLILATNGLWEALDKKEVTALAITLFQAYKETDDACIQKRVQAKGSLFSPNNVPCKSKSNTNTPSQSEADYTNIVTINPGVTLSDSPLLQSLISNSENTGILLPEMTHSENETYEHSAPEDSSGKEKESCPQNFYERAAAHISHEIVNAALEAGSKDNITVMVILLSGLEYQFNL